jgi:hypothetical protein
VGNGEDALHYDTTGSNNTANGFQSFYSLKNGNNNVADGANAFFALTNGNNNIGIGYGAGSNIVVGSSDLDIGNPGAVGDAGIIRIGDPSVHTATYIAGAIYGNAGGLTNVPATAVSGGLTVNLAILVPGGATNILRFTNGILMQIQ